jgi:hypothetical protein
MVTAEAIILPSFSVYFTVTLSPALASPFILTLETSKVMSPFVLFTVIIFAAVSTFVTSPVHIMALLFVTLVVVSFFSGVLVVVVVVVFCSGVPAGAWANTTVTNATLITTVSAIINTFFIFFLLLEF